MGLGPKGIVRIWFIIECGASGSSERQVDHVKRERKTRSCTIVMQIYHQMTILEWNQDVIFRLVSSKKPLAP